MQDIKIKDQNPHCSKHVLGDCAFTSDVYLMDCIEGMKHYPDKYFDLAVVDVPYGIGESLKKRENTTSDKWKAPTKKVHNPKDWDKEPPNLEYFYELFRVSKNQIVWGANHFIEKINKNSSCWLVWNKKTAGNNADCELAWSSFKTAVRRFDFMWEGFWQENMKDKEKRIHPTQKPVALYDWILHNYAKEGDLILDTHLGSGSSRIAAYKGGFNFVGFEIDQEYYEKQEKRFNDFISQLRLF